MGALAVQAPPTEAEELVAVKHAKGTNGRPAHARAVVPGAITRRAGGVTRHTVTKGMGMMPRGRVSRAARMRRSRCQVSRARNVPLRHGADVVVAVEEAMAVATAMAIAPQQGRMHRHPRIEQAPIRALLLLQSSVRVSLRTVNGGSILSASSHRITCHSR